MIAEKASRVRINRKKTYSPETGAAAPQIVLGDEASVSPVALMGDDSLRVRSLMPDGPAYDFAVNTMTYDPGAALSMVEILVMEHGLLMPRGGHLQARRLVVPGRGRRLHLDGALLSAMVWRAWKTTGEVLDLQRLAQASAGSLSWIPIPNLRLTD